MEFNGWKERMQQSWRAIRSGGYILWRRDRRGAGPYVDAIELHTSWDTARCRGEFSGWGSNGRHFFVSLYRVERIYHKHGEVHGAWFWRHYLKMSSTITHIRMNGAIKLWRERMLAMTDDEYYEENKEEIETEAKRMPLIKKPPDEREWFKMVEELVGVGEKRPRWWE